MNNNNKNYDKKYAINNSINVIPIANSNVGLKLVVSEFTKKNKTTQFVALNSDEFEYDLSDKKSFINLLHCLYSENHSQLNTIVDIMKTVGLIDNEYFQSLSNKNKEDKIVNKNTRLEVSYNSNGSWILFPEKFKNEKHFINWMNKNYKDSFIDDHNSYQQNIEHLKNYTNNNVFKVKEITIIDEIDTTSFTPNVNEVNTVSFNPDNKIASMTISNPVNTVMTTSDYDHIALKNSVDQLPEKTRDEVRKLATEKIKTFSPTYAKTGEYGRFPNKNWKQYDQMFSIWTDTYKEVLNIKENVVNTLLNGSGNTEEELVETIATSESGL